MYLKANYGRRNFNMKKLYYAVLTTVYNDGNVISNIVDYQYYDIKPEPVFTTNWRCDTYIDYFDSEQEAKEFVKQSRTI